MWVISPNLFELIDFPLNLFVLLIMKHRIEHLVEVHLWNVCNIFLQGVEEVAEQILISCAQIGTSSASSFDYTLHTCKREHIIVAYSAIC